MTTVLFIIGSVVFAITVYGLVIAGGLRLTKQTLQNEEPELGNRVEAKDLEGLPTDVKF